MAEDLKRPNAPRNEKLTPVDRLLLEEEEEEGVVAMRTIRDKSATTRTSTSRASRGHLFPTIRGQATIITDIGRHLQTTSLRVCCQAASVPAPYPDCIRALNYLRIIETILVAAVDTKCERAEQVIYFL